VIPLTSNTPNRHTRAKIRIADACHDHARPIATRITLNTGSAKTSHTFGSNVADAGSGIDVIASLLGHSWVSSSQVYVHPDPARLREAVDRVPSPLDGTAVTR